MNVDSRSQTLPVALSPPQPEGQPVTLAFRYIPEQLRGAVQNCHHRIHASVIIKIGKGDPAMHRSFLKSLSGAR